MTRTVLLTGAGGFLAGHVARAFARSGWSAIGVGRSDPNRQVDLFAAFHFSDLSEPQRLLSILDRYTPDALVHLAAPASVQRSISHPQADFLGHVIPTANVLEAVRLSEKRPAVILVSSAAVYGNPGRLPVTEDAPISPISPYGFHKVHQEQLLSEYAAIHGVRGCVVRVFSTYGENLRGLAVWEITRPALAANRTVFGTGDETRDYLYARDVADAVVCVAARAEFAGEQINIASGQEVSIRTLVSEIYRLLDIDVEPEFTGRAAEGSPIHWRADTTRLRALGFDPAPWSAGLVSTVAWIRQHA